MNAGAAGQFANTIILNASGAALNGASVSSCYIKPIRSSGVLVAQLPLYYDNAGGELTYGVPTSDQRLKSNIVSANLDICYNVIKNLKLKRFRFDEDIYSDKQCIDRNRLGWIAQEVEQVLPKSIAITEYELANGTVINDCMMLDPAQIYAAMYGAVQKIIKTIEYTQTGTGTIIPDSSSTAVTVSGITGSSTIQITPIFNGTLRNLNVSLFDSTSNCFTVYGEPGDFFWTVTT